MRIKTNWGFCTLRFFEKGDNGLRIQIFWPWLRFKKTKLSKQIELSGYADTCFRFVTQKGYKGFGFNLMGFGLGFDYQYDKP